WARPVSVDQRPGDRVDQLLRNYVVGTWILLEPSSGNRSASERVVNLVLRTQLQQFGEIATQHRQARGGWGAVVPRPRIANSLVGPEDERLIAAVIHLRDPHRASN